MIFQIPPIHPLDNENRWRPHRWFAWRPVMIGERWFWLQTVSRCMEPATDWEGSNWRYSYQEPQPGDLPIDLVRDLPAPAFALAVIAFVIYGLLVS